VDPFGFIFLLPFNYGLGSITLLLNEKGKIVQSIKNIIKHCNSCGNQLNIKKLNECPNCKYRIKKALKIKHENLFAFGYLFFALVFLIKWVFFFNYTWDILTRTILESLYLICIIIYIFGFVKYYYKSISDIIIRLKKDLSYCLKCGSKINPDITYKCDQCGYTFPIKELEEF
jgi:hypothetical protein